MSACPVLSKAKRAAFRTRKTVPMSISITFDAPAPTPAPVTGDLPANGSHGAIIQLSGGGFAIATRESDTITFYGPDGVELIVTTFYEMWDAQYLSIAATVDGGLVVAADRYGATGIGRFDAEGHLLDVSTSNLNNLEIEALPDGGFVLVGQVGDVFGGSLFLQRYNAAGDQVANILLAEEHYFSDVAVLASGEIIVVFEDGRSDVFTQRVSAQTNTLIGSPVQVPAAAAYEMEPQIAALAGGGYVVTYHSYGGASTVVAQVYDAADLPVGGLINLDSSNNDSRFTHSVIPTPDGGFYIGWGGADASGDMNVYARRFDAGGSPAGDAFRFSVATAGNQYVNTQNYGGPFLTITEGGHLVMTWEEGASGLYRVFDLTRAFEGYKGGNPIPLPITWDDGGGPVATLFVLSGLPDGAVLSAGTPDGAGGWTLQPGDLAGLTVTLPADYDGTFTLQVAVEDSAAGLWTASHGVTVFDNVLLDPEVFAGTPGEDVHGGGGAADQLSGAAGKDTLSGLAGDDLIDGGDDNDLLYGGDGADDLVGGLGGDILYGDAGADDLHGGDGADKLYGGTGQDLLNGGTGNDRMDGQSDIDTLNGGTGNDYLDGGLGADILRGGADNDVYIVDDAGDQTIEAAGEGYDIVRTTLTWTLAAELEGLELQGLTNAAGTGNAGANNLQGNGGANVLSGLAGVDTLNGNDGDDIIIGGVGNDLLRGGLGADTFRVAHAFGGVLETDQVYDFSAPEGDTVDVSDSYNLVSAFSKVAGQMTLTFASGFTTLKIDATGDGKADYQMKLNGDLTGDTGWLV